MNSSDKIGIMNTILMNRVVLVSRMNDEMAQQRQMRPADEWYM
jgi:hypothetical protein